MPFCLFWPRCGKGKLEDGDSINLNDIEKVLPTWQVGAGAGSLTAHRSLSVDLRLGGACALRSCLSKAVGGGRSSPCTRVSHCDSVCGSLLLVMPRAACGVAGLTSSR